MPPTLRPCCATTGSARAAFVPRTVDGDERVKPLELFFDLVFVFAITQVTGMLSEDPTWAGLARGLLVLGVLWWAWVAYAWLTNTVDPDEGIVRLAMFAAMAAMLVVSLAAPEAFDEEALLFGVGYFLVRALHIVLYAIASRGNPDLRAAVVRLALGVKKTLGDVGGHLETIPALGLCGGVALYLLGHVLFRLRNVHTLNRQRLVDLVAVAAFTPLATRLPALAALGVVFSLSAGLIAYEAIRFAEARDRVRHAPKGEAAAAEAAVAPAQR